MGRRLRLSPNEEARILREEKERRRKLRIIQVTSQAINGKSLQVSSSSPPIGRSRGGLAGGFII